MTELSQLFFYVLIPVFNTEKYLDDCIQSVLNQQYRHYKVILVDDGSTDSSGQICDKYAGKYDFIDVIHQTNQGLIAARRAAVNKVLGECTGREYVLFLDSDDTFKPDALSEIKNAVEEYSADMIVFNLDRVYQGSIIDVPFFRNKHLGVVEDKEFLYNIVLLNDKYNPLCRKAISVGLLANDDYRRFYGINLAEDLLQSIVLYKRVTKVLFIDKALYNYTYNPKSISADQNSRNYVNNFSIRQEVYDFVKGENNLSKAFLDNFKRYNIKIISKEALRVMFFKDSYRNRMAILDNLRNDSYCKEVFGDCRYRDIISRLMELRCYGLLCFFADVRGALARVYHFLKGTRKDTR